MKNLLSLIAVAMLCLQPSLSTYALDETPSPNDVKTLTLQQAETLFQLEHKEAEPIYGTQQVPDTCYHDVQHGTRQDCHTEYDHQCHTNIENQCENVPYPVCQNVQENVCNPVSFPVCQQIQRNECRNVPEQICQQIQRNECRSVPFEVCESVPQQVCENHPTQECRDVTVPVCQNVPRQVCETTQQCTTVQDNVCHGTPPNQVCQTVPRRQCEPVQSCHTVNDSVCHNETRHDCRMVDHQSCHTETRRQCHNDSRQECHTVPDTVCHMQDHQECHTVPDTVCHNETRQDCHLENRNRCHDEYRQECADVPVEHCQDIPRQACQTVPNMVSEPYACTKDVRVQTGERVKAHAVADVKIIVSNYGTIDLSKENLKVKLVGNDVVLALEQGSNQVILRVVKKEQNVQSISDVDNRITTTFTLEAIPLALLNSLSQIKMGEPVLYFDKVSFKLEGANVGQLPIVFDQGHLLVVQKRFIGRATILNQDFDALVAVKRVGDHYEIPFQTFGVSYLNSKLHTIELNLSTKSILNPAELLNPALLNQVSMKPIEGSYYGYPISE